MRDIEHMFRGPFYGDVSVMQRAALQRFLWKC